MDRKTTILLAAGALACASATAVLISALAAPTAKAQDCAAEIEYAALWAEIAAAGIEVGAQPRSETRAIGHVYAEAAREALECVRPNGGG